MVFLVVILVIAALALIVWAFDLHNFCITPRFMCKRCTQLPHCSRWAKARLKRK